MSSISNASIDFIAVAFNLFGATEPHKFLTCVHRTLCSWENEKCFFLQIQNKYSGRGDGGAGGALAPHFLLRWNLRMCILLFFVSMYLWIFVHNLRYKGLLLGVSKALWDAQFYLSSKHSGADFKFYRISGPPTQILAPRPLKYV